MRQRPLQVCYTYHQAAPPIKQMHCVSVLLSPVWKESVNHTEGFSRATTVQTLLEPLPVSCLLDNKHMTTDYSSVAVTDHLPRRLRGNYVIYKLLPDSYLT